jgi:cobalt-zinc-cadmium efflux system protein
MAFAVGIALNIGFVAIEGGYGFISNSVALVADAGHNFSDVLGLIVAWVATALSKRKPSQRFTYGLRSSSILAALVNAVFLLVAVGAIAYEAVHRFFEPSQIAGLTVVVVASIGILINGATALLFMKGSKGDLNIRGAFLHMAADAGVSAGVVIAGFVVMFTGWLWIDPLVSLLIVLVVVIGTWSLLRDSTALTLHAVPPGIDATAVRSFLAARTGVSEVHDLHIWAMSTTETALTCHLVIPAGFPGDSYLADVAHDLRDQFSIAHATIQVETAADGACALAPDHVV